MRGNVPGSIHDDLSLARLVCRARNAEGGTGIIWRAARSSLRMLSLRATVKNTAAGHLEIILQLCEDGRVTSRAALSFNSPTDRELLEDLRWLMEDFLSDGSEASRVRAARVKDNLSREGIRLFDAVFGFDVETRNLWSSVRTRLHETRLEIAADASTLSSLPWELMRAPESSKLFFLSTKAFVRVNVSSETEFGLRAIEGCRLLLITSRPSGTEDVAYRSIAFKILREIQDDEQFDVTFLRPPTFAQCARVLRDAHADGRPFDVIHFDGHGFFVDTSQSASAPPGPYILFEHESGEGDRPVSGREFADLVTETGCSSIVLNACRSGHVDNWAPDQTINSFSDDLVTRGAKVVVAMRYNVYVASALRFVSELYRQLSRGQSIVAAASLARKNMATDSAREGVESFDLEDWIVPVILQAGDDLVISCQSNPPTDNRDLSVGSLVFSALPPPPDIGFVGADNSLLSIDRAFDDASVVLIHGLAGAGKSACAAEFVRWYSLTRGFSGPALFTSFEEVPTLDHIVSTLEPVIMRRAGAQWLELNSTQRARLASTLVPRGSVLWIWDNVESLHRVPASVSDEIVTFLRDAGAAGVKFILTSRSREAERFGNLPMRIEMAPLQDSESIEFASRMARRLGRRRVAAQIVWPVIEYCEGNPLTLSIAFSTFLTRTRSSTEQDATRFISELRSGETPFDDNEAAGRTKSLMASLKTGFEALSHHTLRRIALLHLFRSYVNINVLLQMCCELSDGAIVEPTYERNWNLTEFGGESLRTLQEALDRATEVGLLRRSKPEHYWLHPAIQLYLGQFFRRFFPRQADRERAARSFAESFGLFGIRFTVAHGHGLREEALRAMIDEEANFRNALTLSREYGWAQAEIGLLHGLFTQYWHSGRRAEWAALLEETLPQFIDSHGHALPGRERWWTFLVDHLVRLAMWRRDFQKAKELSQSVLAAERETVAAIVVGPNGSLPERQRNEIQSLGIALGRHADILSELDNPECLTLNEEALAVYRSIGDRVGISVRLFNLGHVFKNVTTLRDLDRAEDYYGQSLESYPAHDTVGRMQCLGQLGAVALQRLKDELYGARRDLVLVAFFDKAVDYYQQVLAITPAEDLVDLAQVHNQLGVTYQYTADGAGEAFEHFRLAVHFYDLSQETYESVSARMNAAQILQRLHRPEEALIFAEEAVAIIESTGIQFEYLDVLQSLVSELKKESSD